ncbi:MAG TPA: hypothetical protein VF691_12485, partial [Cytophagaceae bacterium]
MLGHAEGDSLMVWAQTKKPASVKFLYWDILDSNKIWNTPTVLSSPDNAYIVKTTFKFLSAGRTYKYSLEVDDTTVIFKYPLTFTFKNNADSVFKFALGSCVGIPDDTSDFNIF